MKNVGGDEFHFFFHEKCVTFNVDRKLQYGKIKSGNHDKLTDIMTEPNYIWDIALNQRTVNILIFGVKVKIKFKKLGVGEDIGMFLLWPYQITMISSWKYQIGMQISTLNYRIHVFICQSQIPWEHINMQCNGEKTYGFRRWIVSRKKINSHSMISKLREKISYLWKKSHNYKKRFPKICWHEFNQNNYFEIILNYIESIIFSI